MNRINTLGDVRRVARTSTGTGFLLAGLGLAVWIGLSVWGGIIAGSGFRLREAWDTAAYFYFGLPLMVVAVGLSGFARPDRPWRWPLWLVGGHQIGVLLIGLGMQSGLSLIILTTMLAVLLAVFFAVPAFLGALAARTLMRAY